MLGYDIKTLHKESQCISIITLQQSWSSGCPRSSRIPEVWEMGDFSQIVGGCINWYCAQQCAPVCALSHSTCTWVWGKAWEQEAATCTHVSAWGTVVYLGLLSIKHWDPFLQILWGCVEVFPYSTEMCYYSTLLQILATHAHSNTQTCAWFHRSELRNKWHSHCVTHRDMDV